MNVGQIIDRLYLEWLSRTDDRPIEDEITDNPLTAGATSMTLSGALTPEEENLLTPGTISAIRSELVRTTDYDPDTKVHEVRRAQLGTTAVEHPQFTVLTIAPTFARPAVFNTVCDCIVGLWPDLWSLGTEMVYAETISELEDETIREIVSVTDINGFEVPFIPLIGYGDVDSGNALRFNAADCGQEVIVRFTRSFTRPTAETDELSDLHVDEVWQEIILISAASKLLRGKEVDTATIEFLTEALESAGVRLGELTDVATALLRYRELLVSKQKSQLIASQGVSVIFNRTI